MTDWIMARSGDESSGFWWLPRGPENKVAGSLSFSDEDGIRLTLIGSFGDIEGLNRFEREPLILGIVKGKLLTLHDCAGAGHSITMPGFVSSSYLIGIVYSGVHFENEEEMIFNRLRVQFDYLADWTQISGFETKITRHPNGQILKYGISYVPPDEVEVQMTSAVLAFESDFTAKQDPPLEANMAQTIWIAIRPKENLSFATMDKDFVYPLRNFLTLATGKPNQITGISVCAAQLDEPLEDGKVQQKTIQVLFRPRAGVDEKRRRLIPNFMLFCFRDVIEEFPSLIQRWFAISKELDSVCHLYFGNLYNRKMYVDSRFLNLVQALESYHRRRMKNEVLPRIDHRKRVRTILRNVEPDHRPWLKEHLQYSNEPRLRNRLLDLLGRARDVMAPLIGNNEGAFAKTVTDTRNFLIHYDQHLKSQSLGGEDLFFVTEKLSILLQSCLLLELGLSAEKCLKLFQRNEDYQWATSRPWTLN